MNKIQITNPLTTIGPCTIRRIQCPFSNRYVGHDELGYGAVDNHGDHDGYIGHPDDQGPGRPVRERESLQGRDAKIDLDFENYQGTFLD